MSLWKAARFLLVFLVLLVVGDRVLAAFLNEAVRFSSLPLAKLYTGRGEADVLVLGNSRALRHFDEFRLAQSLGLRVSNLAVLGGSMETMSVILDDYIARYGPPKAVILEPSCTSFDNHHLRNMRFYARRSPGLRSILRRTAPTLARAGDLSHLFAFNGTSYLGVLHKAVSPYRQELFEGSVALDAVLPEGRPYFFNRTYNLNALDRTVEMVRRHGIHLEVVMSPVFPGFGATGNAFREWFSILSERVGKSGRLANYTDLRLPSSAFYDPVHLNKTGVAAFHDRLVEDGIIGRLRGE